MRKILLCILLLFLGQYLRPQAAPGNYEGVMLQGFYWDSYTETNWNALNSQSEEIASYFDLVWLPPSGNAQGSPQFPSMGYHPIWYFDQNSSFGASSELKSLINSLKDKGCGSVADIVINHRNGTTNWTNFPSETYKGVTYTWGAWAICSDDEVKDATGQETPAGAPDTGENWDGARDIDHTNEYVQNTIKAYLDFMKNEMGYIGWRYDFVKGFAPYYVGMYNMSAGCNFSVGECWDNYDVTTAWIDGTKINNEIRSGAFDFALKYALRDACNYGQWNNLMWTYYGNPQPAGLIHNSGFKRFAYTFVDNHDTANGSDAISAGNILAANAFILTHPGIPCVFYPHWKSYKNDIQKLIGIRKMVGINNQSSVEIKETANDIYVAEVFGARGSLILKIGSRYDYTPPSGYIFKISGNNFAVWTKSAQEGSLTSSATPIVPNIETTLYYDGTNTNFAAWSPDSHIHAWLVPKAGETFSKIYNMDWAYCEGPGDYSALDSKVKMTMTGAGTYSININIQNFFDVTEEDLGKIAKLGVIVRALYDEGSLQNRTINFLLNVTDPAPAYEGYAFYYGVDGDSETWTSMPLTAESDEITFSTTWNVPENYRSLSCYAGYNEGVGNPLWVEGRSAVVTLEQVSGFQTGEVIVSINKNSSNTNWDLKIRPQSVLQLKEDERPAGNACYSIGNEIVVKTEGKANVKIYSIYGMQIKHAIIDSEAVFTNLTSGVYFVKINNDTRKILVK